MAGSRKNPPPMSSMDMRMLTTLKSSRVPGLRTLESRDHEQGGEEQVLEDQGQGVHASADQCHQDA